VIWSATAALPASAEDGASAEIAPGGARFAAGEVMVKESLLDVPEELETETTAVVDDAVSMGKIAA
jgi:hypothetical protein